MELSPLPSLAPVGVSYVFFPSEGRSLLRARWIARSADVTVTNPGDGSDLVVHVIPRDQRPPLRFEVDPVVDFRCFLPAIVAYLENNP